MYPYISNKLVFTRTRVLDSLLMFVILMFVPNITANHETWLHLVESRAATADGHVLKLSEMVCVHSPGILSVSSVHVSCPYGLGASQSRPINRDLRPVPCADLQCLTEEAFALLQCPVTIVQ